MPWGWVNMRVKISMQISTTLDNYGVENVQLTLEGNISKSLQP
jgi:hypothetical protein